MDRNQVIGLVLMSVLLLLYFNFFTEKPTRNPEQLTDTTTVTQPANPIAQIDTTATPIQPVDEPDSARSARQSAQYGLFASAAEGTSEEVTLENDELQCRYN